MEAKKMANMSSSGIETIVHCLTKAVEATRGLDSNLSQNLCFALNIANSEAGRVAKSMRKASASQKTAKIAKIAKTAKTAKTGKTEKTEKKAAKSTRTAMPAKQQQQQSKIRRKAGTLNGAVAH
jgi:hypothetical protein